MTAIHERPNRATPSEAASFIEEFDRIEQDREEKLRVLDADFKAKKRAIQKIANDDQKSILEDAKKQGVNKGVIRAITDAQKLRRKSEALAERAENKIDGLEEDDREFAVDIRQALGDDFASFGLGAAAVSREDADDDEEDGGQQDETTAAVVNAVRAGASKEEWDGAGAKH